MNKRLAKFVGAVSTVCYIGLSTLIAGADTRDAKTRVPHGEYKITPSTKNKGSLLVEANNAPLTSLLQAIAQQSNCKIIFSNEAQEKLKGILLTYVAMDRPKPLEFILEFLASSTLSWGKVGEDTYLVVPRQQSPAEIAAQKTRMDEAKVSSDEYFEQLRKRREEERKQMPEQAPWNARPWLLTPAQE